MLTVSILNYNGKGIIERAVDSVLNQSFKPTEILVIDNGSTDDSWKLVEKHVTRVVHADNKFKFITGLNVAFEEASQPVVTFMENDIILHEDCLGEMYQSDYNIVSPKFFDKDGGKYKVEWYAGFLSACFTMNKSTYEAIGKFDEKLAPAYWEDVDYSIRAKRMGYSCKKDVGSAIHYANWSFSKVFTKKQMGSWCKRNAWYIAQKHYLSRAFPFLYTGRIFSSNKTTEDCK